MVANLVRVRHQQQVLERGKQEMDESYDSGSNIMIHLDASKRPKRYLLFNNSGNIRRLP